MYNKAVNFRETAKHYIPATDKDLQEMLAEVGCSSLTDLYAHINSNVQFDDELNLPTAYTAESIIEQLKQISEKNKVQTSFLGDDYTVQSVVPKLCEIRGLTTSYTPYQPERSQGTLLSHWIYQCVIAEITGFEAINASMYDRSSALFEAIKCAAKIQKNKNSVLITAGIKPNDIEVLKTLAAHTEINLIFESEQSFSLKGVSNITELSELIKQHSNELGAVVFPQTNKLGNLEDVDSIVNLTQQSGLLAIAVINPILLGNGGLKPPVEFGDKGADIFVAEGQHLAIAPNFGGPGLGIFGIRFNDQTSKHIRATAGRFVGDAKDVNGKTCKVIVLSTREQHIRREKANSNICSNQAFVATLAGASLLQLGAKGLQNIASETLALTKTAVQKLTAFNGVELAFKEANFFNEFTLVLNKNIDLSKEKISIEKIENKINNSIYLKLRFDNKNTLEDVEKLESVFSKNYAKSTEIDTHKLDSKHLRKNKLELIKLSESEIVEYYKKLGNLNLSPDNTIYPLGSCTMKYNPYLNDYTANFEGFTNSHPNDVEENVQGSLEVLYQIQEYFKVITGLPAVTTQPLAGAQGELVGLKMFQAYHQNNNEVRDVILIPKSAHGTNPATAAYAGFTSNESIALVDALPNGLIDFENLSSLVAKYGTRICGIMITNPNTSGLFEVQFKQVADLIHSVGGFVYMDGANMNAIAGWIDLSKLGVDAVHNNLHKTWSIPHGGGGPGDAIVAVSEKLIDYLPGIQVVKSNGVFKTEKPVKSIGSIHRDFGNFAHKVRCYTYLLALGSDGIKKMSAVAVLASRYLFSHLNNHFETIPKKYDSPVMHEFIITFSDADFEILQQKTGFPKVKIISQFGKLFLDYGYHAPTVSFPQELGLMIEPTESYTKQELDDFANTVIQMKKDVFENPNILLTAPTKAPIAKVDEVEANRRLKLSEKLTKLPELPN